MRRSIIWKMSSEEFKTLVGKSESISDILLSLGLCNRGGTNHNTIKRRMREEGIEWANNRTSKQKAYSKKIKRPIQEVMVENSDYARSCLRKRLIMDGIIPYICQSCNLQSEWNNKKLSLVLDHINGIHNDNRLENLRFLCPNCNSQTDTFAGKNQQYRATEKITLCICGNKITSGAKACRRCSQKQQRRVNRPNKDVLQNDIDNLGYVGTGRKYGVSDNAIRKWIKSGD